MIIPYSKVEIRPSLKTLSESEPLPTQQPKFSGWIEYLSVVKSEDTSAYIVCDETHHR